MKAWSKLSALAAVLIVAAGPAAAQSDKLIEPAQVISAADDCMASFKDYEVNARLLKARGWKELKGDAGDLRGMLKFFLRQDGVLMLSLRYSCIVKVRMTPSAMARLQPALSQRLGSLAEAKQDGQVTWHFNG